MKRLLFIALAAFGALVGIAYAQSFSATETKVHTLSVSGWTPDLMRDFNTISGFSKTIIVSEPSHLFVTGHIDVDHRGIAGTADKAIGAAFRVLSNGSTIPGSKTGENMTSDGADNYYAAQIHAYQLLQPSVTYTIEVQGRSYSSAAPNTDGLAEVKDGYNQVLLITTPVSIATEN